MVFAADDSDRSLEARAKRVPVNASGVVTHLTHLPPLDYVSARGPSFRSVMLCLAGLTPIAVAVFRRIGMSLDDVFSSETVSAARTPSLPVAAATGPLPMSITFVPETITRCRICGRCATSATR